MERDQERSEGWCEAQWKEGTEKMGQVWFEGSVEGFVGIASVSLFFEGPCHRGIGCSS